MKNSMIKTFTTAAVLLVIAFVAGCSQPPEPPPALKSTADLARLVGDRVESDALRTEETIEIDLPRLELPENRIAELLNQTVEAFQTLAGHIDGGNITGMQEALEQSTTALVGLRPEAAQFPPAFALLFGDPESPPPSATPIEEILWEADLSYGTLARFLGHTVPQNSSEIPVEQAAAAILAQLDNLIQDQDMTDDQNRATVTQMIQQVRAFFDGNPVAVRDAVIERLSELEEAAEDPAAKSKIASLSQGVLAGW